MDINTNTNIKKRKEHPAFAATTYNNVLLGQQWSDDTNTDEGDSGCTEQPPFKKRRLMGLLDAARIVSVAPSMEAPTPPTADNEDAQALLDQDTIIRQEAGDSRVDNLNKVGFGVVRGPSTRAFSPYEMPMTQPITEATTINPPPDFSSFDTTIVEQHTNSNSNDRNDELLDDALHHPSVETVESMETTSALHHPSVETVASTETTSVVANAEAIQAPTAAHGHETNDIFSDAFENEDDWVPRSVAERTDFGHGTDEESTQSERNDESEDGDYNDDDDDDDDDEADDETESEDSMDDEDDDDVLFWPNEHDGLVEEEHQVVDTRSKRRPSMILRLSKVLLVYMLTVCSFAFVTQSTEYCIPETLQLMPFSIPKWTNFCVNCTWYSEIRIFLDAKLDSITQKSVDNIMDMFDFHTETPAFSFDKVGDLMEESAASIERLGKIGFDSTSALASQAKNEVREVLDRWTQAFGDSCIAVSGHTASIVKLLVVILNRGLRRTLELCGSFLEEENLVWLWEHWKGLMESIGFKGQSYPVHEFQKQSQDIAAHISELETVSKSQRSRIERI